MALSRTKQNLEYEADNGFASSLSNNEQSMLKEAVAKTS